MKHESEMKVLKREFAEVESAHKAQHNDRMSLIKKREELIRGNTDEKCRLRHQVKVSAKEVSRLEQLLAKRYSKVIQKAFWVFDADKSGNIDPAECGEVWIDSTL